MSANESTGVDKAVASMVASAKHEAEQYPGSQRWVLLSLYVEIHRRTAAELERLTAEAST
jgi:hypothetical protein